MVIEIWLASAIAGWLLIIAAWLAVALGNATCRAVEALALTLRSGWQLVRHQRRQGAEGRGSGHPA